MHDWHDDCAVVLEQPWYTMHSVVPHNHLHHSSSHPCLPNTTKAEWMLSVMCANVMDDGVGVLCVLLLKAILAAPPHLIRLLLSSVRPANPPRCLGPGFRRSATAVPGWTSVAPGPYQRPSSCLVVDTHHWRPETGSAKTGHNLASIDTCHTHHLRPQYRFRRDGDKCLGTGRTHHWRPQ